MIQLDACCAPFCNKFVDVTLRHTNYLIYASSYVENLKNKSAVLDARKDDMNVKIEDADRKSKAPFNEMVVWKNQVDVILRAKDEVVNAYETRSCLRAICSGYKTGYRCDEMIKEVDGLLDRGSVYLNAEMMDRDNSKAPISMPYVVPESLDLESEDVLKYIEDDNSMANVIGIWGMGGVGKTTLLKKIHNYFTGRTTFSHIIWAVASSEQSNVSKIQSEIIEKLKLDLDENDDVRSKALKIYHFLRNKNFILFIDDLWQAVDLNEVGVPKSYEAGCGKKGKVVFTTRSKDVCGDMEAKKRIEVKCLDWTQSWVLFKEMVGEQVIQSHPRISTLAKDVANECKGLPLALKTIGRAMYDKTDPTDWKVALELMKNSHGHDILGAEEQLLSVLKISYDLLPSDELRNCFLSVSLWPEDFIINRDELIMCLIGLDVIDKFESMDEAYRIGHSLIGRLLSASLLENTEMNRIGSYMNRTDSYIGVKIHDVLRDLALWIASDCGKNKHKWMVKAKTHLQYTPSLEVEKTECISLMYDRLNKLPSGITRCSNLLTLILRSNNLTCESITDCFHNFHSLKYLDLEHNWLDGFPETICYLTELQYLNLSYNNIEIIPEKLRNLTKLKYLILRENLIYNLPSEVFSELVNLLVLDMFSPKILFGPKNPKYYKDYSMVNELKWLGKRLLYLGIVVRDDKEFDKLLNLSDLQIVALCLKYLHITSFNFMSIIPNPYCLRELEIEICDGLVEIIFEKNDIGLDLLPMNLEKLALVGLHEIERILWKDIEPKNLFAELRRLEIFHCNINDITWVIHLPSLIELKIGCCDNMRIAINNDDNDNTYEVEPSILTFPSLRFLEFNSVINLEKISTRSLAFPDLRLLTVFECPLLETLPFEIESTPNIRGILAQGNWWDKLEWKDDNSRSHFSQFIDKVGLI